MAAEVIVFLRFKFLLSRHRGNHRKQKRQIESAIPFLFKLRAKTLMGFELDRCMAFLPSLPEDVL
ncbi:hypothetical protein ACPOL_6858 (plasmid) [Acidisarcina polymorpha]|uniref:Uncharacterized protein n=1 Tax=Acidisarcina polymorpha TaxID=2211140 RepID=A0A2Z5GBN3_9BACT|nr:hypothetical protein ACPOL_6858 [Acidisarcina polymorpha]